MQTIFYHNSSGSEAFTGNLKQREIHRAITLHPVKQHRHFYRLHNYFLSLRMRSILQTNLLLHRDTRIAMENLSMTPGTASQGESNEQQPPFLPLPPKNDGPALGNSWEMGKQPSLIKLRPRNDSEVLKWDFIHRAIYSFTHSNPRRKVDAVVTETLDDVVNQIMDTINRFSKQRGRVIDFKDILYAYQRVDPIHGADYILDMLLVYKKYRGRKMTLPVRKHVYVQRSFTDLQVREIPRCPFPVTDDAAPRDVRLVNDGSVKRINFILPLSGRWKIFQRFMANFEDVCLSRRKYLVSLTVILFPESATDASLNNLTAASVKSLLKNMDIKYGGGLLTLEEHSGSFSRALALEVGSARFNPNDLLLFIDVDMHFNHHFLRRVCTNTILGKQVYFPIVFSQYDPSVISDGANLPDAIIPDLQLPKDSRAKNYEDEIGESDETTISDSSDEALFRIDRRLGYWRVFGFGIVSLYRDDLMKVGGLDTNIRGWGQEDVDLYDKVIRSELNAFRAVDPGLIHVFHPIDCDEKLSQIQLTMCQGSRASSYASVETLAQIVYGKPDILHQSYVGKVVAEEVSGVQR